MWLGTWQPYVARSSMNPVSLQGSPTAEWFYVTGATWVQLVLLGFVEEALVLTDTTSGTNIMHGTGLPVLI